MDNKRKAEILRRGFEINYELTAILDEVGDDVEMMRCLNATVSPSISRIIDVVFKDSMKMFMNKNNKDGRN